MSENKYKVPALGRAAAILDFLSARNAEFPEIVRELGLPKSSVYSLLLTLEEIGFVRRLPDSHQYALGFRLFELGNLAVSKVSIRDHAITFLRKLSAAQKVTCHLGALDGREAVYLLKVDPQDNILINSWEGKRLGLTSSAMGKVLLAWLPPDRQRQLLKTLNLTPKTPKTIVDMDDFRNHVADVKHQGWAMDDEEDVLGIRCLAAPVFTPDGGVRYSLSISSTVQRITMERVPELVEVVKDTAREISLALGTPSEAMGL